MTALDHPVHVPAAPRRFPVLRALGVRVTAWMTAFDNRRYMGRLAEMSDHQLADIGLERSDVHQAARVSLASDPTRMLTEMRARRIRRGA